jgi:hypothetical protein
VTLEPEQVRAFCEQAGSGLDSLTFEQKRAILEMLNVSAVIDWQGRGEATIILSGYFPETTINTDNFDGTALTCSA